MSRRAAAILTMGLGLMLSACEGSGTGGDGLVVRSLAAPDCTSAGGPFPSGLALLSESTGRAAVAQVGPPGIAVYSTDGERPVRLGFRNIGVDSDGDGRDDQQASEPLFPCELACSGRSGGVSPIVGALELVHDRLALLGTSGYEQILPIDPSTTAAIELTVDVPPTVGSDRYPLLPPPGESASRTGISTLACIFPPDPVDSEGASIPPDPRCDPKAASYLSSFTAGAALAAGRLFVATSNFALRRRAYLPGTVLVYDWSDGGAGIVVRPLADHGILFTTGFNPTGLARYVTPAGRELVLVTVTGAIEATSVPDSARSEAAIDVIDPSGPRIVATIPLGFAGASFQGAVIEPTGRVGWLGSATSKQLYAIDLDPLDDPRLFDASGPPVILDGLTTGFPDARIFSADHPLRLPVRTDRSSGPSCGGWTHVAVNTSGSEVYASDFCDGTLTRIRLDLSGSPSVPVPRDRFRIAGQTAPFAPMGSFGEDSAPGLIATRPGRPGIDFSSPDVYVLVGQPGLVCGLHVEPR